MDKKYQIFVSSTYQDLVEERQAVSRAILDMGHIPAGMELFPAADFEQFTYIKKVIDECDYYILIIGGRYGSLDSSGFSFTEQEYNYAKSSKKPILAFIHANVGDIAFSKSEHDAEKRQKLSNFIEKVRQGRLVQKWTNSLELKASAIVSLQRAFNEMPQTGWVRADATSTEVRQKIIEYREKIAELEHRIIHPTSILPTFDDTASLDQKISIGYNQFRPGNFSQDFTLGELLTVLGDILLSGCDMSDISERVDQAINNRNGGQTVRTVDVRDIRSVIATFVAAGFVEIKRDGGEPEYVLSPNGEAAWIQSAYIKARKDEKNK